MTILQAVMQKLTRNTDSFARHSDTASSDNTIDPKNTAQTISDLQPSLNLAELSQRYAPLIALQAKRQLLEIRIQREDDSLELDGYHSLILDINLQGRYLLLDELFPSVSAHPIRLGDLLTVRHHRQGRLLSFAARVIHISYSGGAPCYALELPEDVGYRQRRIYTRLGFENQQPLTVKLKSPWKTPWFATAYNLSAGGMRLAIGGNILEQLNRGSILPMCDFHLGPDMHINCQARIKGFRFIGRPYRHTQISVEFMGMTPQQRLQIQQYINALAENPVAAA